MYFKCIKKKETIANGSAKRSLERIARNFMSSEDNVNFRTLSEIRLTDQMLDLNGENTLAYDSGSNDSYRMLTFSNSSLIEFSSSSGHFQIDGTFKLCSRVYNNGETNKGQLYTVHAYNNGILVPCFYALLARKSAAEYERLFSKISEMSVFELQQVMMDMELAAFSALNEKYPQCTISFCWFHYKQSWLRWIRINGTRA